jgi:hypothetical protein
MNQVMIVPNAKTSAVVTPYAKNPEYGYVQLEQSAITVSGGWIRENKRSTLLRAKTDLLLKFISTTSKNLTLPGKIVVREYLQSEVPQDVQDRFFNKDLALEDAIAPYVKRAGAGGIELTVGGERILRFSEYDATGKADDLFVHHDNSDDVRTSRTEVVEQQEVIAEF